MYEDRILYAPAREKIMSAAEAAEFIKPNTTIAISGFATAFPKQVPLEMVNLGKAHDLTLLCGAALNPEKFGPIVASGMVKKYSAFQFDPFLQDAINGGDIEYIDCHLGLFARKLRDETFGKLDCAMVEVAKINADGGLVPTVSVGMTDAILECADRIILEVNEAVPLAIEGFHDIPGKNPKTLDYVSERVGETVYRCDMSKVIAVVVTNEPEPEWPTNEKTPTAIKMAENMVDCINTEVAAGRIGKDFTLQVGVGNVANTVLSCLGDSGFKDLKMYTEVFTGEALDVMESGLVSEASTTCFDMGSNSLDKLFADVDNYRKKLVLRPMEMTNGAANILNLDVVAMNTAVEIDIYGNVNSTHVLGSKMIYGVGGSNDFARNAKLTVFLTPSTAKGDRISSIVPMVSHVDNTEHDTDVVVTEWGWADLRGLSPKERAMKLIENCAHPDYRQGLRDYYNEALEQSGPVQTPHNLEKALSWHIRYAKTGTMKE